jgi:hypothetical protein
LQENILDPLQLPNTGVAFQDDGLAKGSKDAQGNFATTFPYYIVADVLLVGRDWTLWSLFSFAATSALPGIVGPRRGVVEVVAKLYDLVATKPHFYRYLLMRSRTMSRQPDL